MKFDRLKDLRCDLNLTQKEIASVLYTTQRQYSRWETGANEPPASILITLANFYNVSLDYIAGRTNSKKISTDLVVNPSKSTIASGEPQKPIKSAKTETPKDPRHR